MLDCYVKMLPVIKAEETLLSYQAARLGAGPKSRGQAQQMKRQVRELVRKMSRYSEKARPHRASSFEDLQRTMPGFGIKVKKKEAPRV
jgi:hypothetical protein